MIETKVNDAIIEVTELPVAALRSVTDVVLIVVAAEQVVELGLALGFERDVVELAAFSLAVGCLPALAVLGFGFFTDRHAIGTAAEQQQQHQGKGQDEL